MQRGHSDKKGDNVADQANVKKALGGQASVGVEEGTLVKLSLRAGYPVKAGNEIVGSVTAGLNLSSDNTFVDSLEEGTRHGMHGVPQRYAGIHHPDEGRTEDHRNEDGQSGCP